MTNTSVLVRAIQRQDRETVLSMWQQFVVSVPSEPGNHAMGAINWDRVMDPDNALQGIVAVDASDGAIGFTLFLSFPFTWSTRDVCYLQDIFVTPENRSMGAAQAMIHYLAKLGEDEGWFKIFWMTQKDNHPAQRLYDKIAMQMNYIRYDLNICEP